MSAVEEEYATHAMLLDSSAKLLDVRGKRIWMSSSCEIMYLLAVL